MKNTNKSQHDMDRSHYVRHCQLRTVI